MDKIHECEKSKGKIVVITSDSRCGYCNQYVPYFLWMEGMDKNIRI